MNRRKLNELNDHLLNQYRNGDILAKEKLINNNKFIIKLVINEMRKGDKKIMYQYGLIGLERAIDTYHFENDVKFFSYAFGHICKEIKKSTRLNIDSNNIISRNK